MRLNEESFSFGTVSVIFEIKNDVRFEYGPSKMYDFVSFSQFGFTLVINFDFEIIEIL